MTDLEEGLVESIFPFAALPPGWWALKLQDRANQLVVHNNRIKEMGKLKQGDKVRFRTTTIGPYGKDGHVYCQKLERVAEELSK